MTRVVPIYFSFLILLVSFCTCTNVEKHGFSIELIHRDSPKSPFYNPLHTHWDRVNNALRRSINAKDIISSSGEYLMNISIGTPPHPILAIVDTGSDLIWTQCKPCTHCFKQDTPLFDPAKSSTYSTIPCDSGPCEMIESDCPPDNCLFDAYIDGCSSQGVLSSDVITIPGYNNSSTSKPEFIFFGCGTNNANGTFDGKVSGVIGLGGGDVSFISQMSWRKGSTINKTFSYCLDSGKVSSKIYFGYNKGIVKGGAGVVSTPLVNSPWHKTHTLYLVTLEAITVDKERVEFKNPWGPEKEGNIVMGSGTVLTILPLEFYSKLVKAVSSKIAASPVESPVHPPVQKGVSLCYKVGDLKGDVPEITANFRGADVRLKAVNAFVQVTEDVVCFAFVGADHRIPIYGNLAQMDFLVGYDLHDGSVSFKPTSCAAAAAN